MPHALGKFIAPTHCLTIEICALVSCTVVEWWADSYHSLFLFSFFYSFFAAARGKNKIALQKPHTYTYACCISGWSSLSTTLQINWHRRYHCIFTRTICLRRKIFEFNQKCRLASERRSSISTRFILIDLFR